MPNQFIEWSKSNPKKTWAFKELEYKKIAIERMLADANEKKTHANAGIYRQTIMEAFLPIGIDAVAFHEYMRKEALKDGVNIPKMSEQEVQRYNADFEKRKEEKRQAEIQERIEYAEKSIALGMEKLNGAIEALSNFELPILYVNGYHQFINRPDSTDPHEERFTYQRASDNPHLYECLKVRLFTLNGHSYNFSNDINQLFKTIDWFKYDLHFENYSPLIDNVTIKVVGDFDWFVTLGNSKASVTRVAVYDMETAILYSLITLIDLCWDDLVIASKDLSGNGVEHIPSEFDFR